MIKTPSTTMIGGAGIWTPGCTVIGGQQNITQLIKSLFASNEQGFAYDPNDLTTMFQDAAWTIPVTAAGQPVGLMLDKSKGLSLGFERITNGNFSNGVTSWNGINGTDEVVANGFLNFISASAANPNVSQGGVFEPNKSYKVSFRVANYVSGFVYLTAYSTSGTANAATAQVSTNGVYTTIIKCPPDATGTFGIRAGTGTTLSITDISAKEVIGNHAYQTTSSMRPLLSAAPQRLDYDAVDDKLITNLPAQLTGCTVARAVPNFGTQILTNQTIPTPYNDNTDHCGLIVINRALTTAETAQITQLFNKAAGV